MVATQCCATEVAEGSALWRWQLGLLRRSTLAAGVGAAQQWRRRATAQCWQLREGLRGEREMKTSYMEEGFLVATKSCAAVEAAERGSGT